MDLPFTLPVAEGTGLQAYRPADIVFADIDMRQIGMSVLCGILLKIIYADRTNAKYAAEIWYKIAWNQLPRLVPQGSGHLGGAILLATRWSR